MLPVSEVFLVAAVYAVAFLICAGTSYIFLRRSVLWAIAFAVVLAILSAWALTALGGGPMHLGRDGVTALAIAVGGPLFAVIWAALARKGRRRFGLLAALGVLCMPSIGIAGFFFERQIVPKAVCSESHIPLRLGQVDLKLVPDLQADVRPDTTLQPMMRYAHGSSHKEDMRRLCDATNKGQTPLQVDLVWLTPGLYLRLLEGVCQSHFAPDHCAGFDVDVVRHLGAVKLMLRDETTLRHEMGLAHRPATESFFFEGDAQNGHMCSGAPGTSMMLSCRLWRAIDDDAVVLITSSIFGGATSHAELLVNLEVGVDYVLRALTP